MKNTILYPFLFIAILCTSCSTNDAPESQEETEASLPEISTPDVENSVVASFTSIQIKGRVEATTGNEIIEYGVVWANEPAPTLESNVVVYDESFRNNRTTKQSVQDFTITISDLEPNQEYFIRIFATSEEGTSYGDEISYSTLNLNGTKWRFLFDHNETTSWIANVEFYEDGTAFYTEPDNPGLYDYTGTWSLEGNILTYDMVPEMDTYLLTGKITENKMNGTYTFQEEGSFLWQAVPYSSIDE